MLVLEQPEMLLVTIGVLIARAKLHLVHEAAKSGTWSVKSWVWMRAKR